MSKPAIVRPSRLPEGDLFLLTAALVGIESVSHNEREIADAIEADLRSREHLTVIRIGDNIVAKTEFGHSRRVILAGHIDTVPVNDNAEPRIEGDRLYGLGATDMKGGIAVMLELARNFGGHKVDGPVGRGRTVDEPDTHAHEVDAPVAHAPEVNGPVGHAHEVEGPNVGERVDGKPKTSEPSVDVTFVFYAKEEVETAHSGLREIAKAQPHLLEGDFAILGEPTNKAIEAGCQGSLRFELELAGKRAHTARPWMGRNAIHRVGEVLRMIDDFPGRNPVIEGCEYRESMQAVAVAGGVAGNVVPDRAALNFSYRFAPDRDEVGAEAFVRDLIADGLEDSDSLAIVDSASTAQPSLNNPLLRALIERNNLEVRAKLGWTDVAFFAQRGIPATNFGPGDPSLAHTKGEFVKRDSLFLVYDAISDLLTNAP